MAFQNQRAINKISKWISWEIFLCFVYFLFALLISFLDRFNSSLWADNINNTIIERNLWEKWNNLIIFLAVVLRCRIAVLWTASHVIAEIFISSVCQRWLSFWTPSFETCGTGGIDGSMWSNILVEILLQCTSEWISIASICQPEPDQLFARVICSFSRWWKI